MRIIKVIRNLVVATAVFACVSVATPVSADGPSGGAVKPPPYVQLATVSFFDQYGQPTTQTDQTTAIQNGLLSAQLLYYSLKAKSTSLDDQFLRSGVDYIIPGRYCISSPIVVPTNVRLILPLGVMLCSLSGTGATSAYTGDTTSTALNNNEQPMVVVPPGAMLGDVEIYATNGTQSVSGMWVGKNWIPSAFTLSAPSCVTGNYQIGDVLKFPQPNKAPFVAAQITLTGVTSGCPSSWTITTAGNYALPPILQQKQWTAANGFTGSIANANFGQVFDPNVTGAYVTTDVTTPSATGAEFTITWTPDFAGAGADYNPGSGLQGDWLLGNINLEQVGTANNATYGHQFAFGANGLQFFTGSINSKGGYYGDYLIGTTDFHPATLSPVQAPVLLKIINSASVDSPNTILDTPSIDFAEIDNSSSISLAGRAFHNSTTSTITNPAFMLGSKVASTANDNSNLQLNFTVYNAGIPTTGSAALSCAYTRSSAINLDVANLTTTGSAVANPNTFWGTIGTGCDASNVLTGRIDGAAYGVFTGTTVPSLGARIWNANTNRFETGWDTIALNILSSPQALNTSAWGTFNTITIADNAVQAPDGTTTGTQLTIGSNGQVRQGFSATGNVPICASQWVKGVTAATLRLQIGDGPASNYFGVQFEGLTSTPFAGALYHVGTGALTGYGIIPNSSTSIPGWFRLWIEGTVNSGSPFFTDTYDGATGTMDVWGAQVQVSPGRCPADYRGMSTSFNGVSGDGLLGYTAIKQGGNSHTDFLVGQTTASVGASATTIITVPNDGTMLEVCGSNGTASFCDVISANLNRVGVVYTDPGTGTPAARTYSTSGSAGVTQLAMGSGTYAVNVFGLAAGQR